VLAACMERANSQRKGQAAAGATARAGGAGVAIADCCLDNRHDRPIMTAGRVLGSPCVLKVCTGDGDMPRHEEQKTLTYTADELEPDRLVLGSAHRELLDEIIDSLMQGTQFLALTGTPRVGKTTMAAAIHEELNKRSVLVRRVDGCHDTGIHLRTIMSQFLGKSEADVDADDAERLFSAMTERETPNERLALIIDDAERLLPDALAYLRLLVSVAPERMPQIVFIGDSSFWDIADRLTEARLKELITAHFVLELLNPTETFGATEAAIDTIATERDQTQVTAAVVDAAAGGTPSPVVNGLARWPELGIKAAATTPVLAHAVPRLVPELNVQRPDRSVARIMSAAAGVVVAVSAATYWLTPLGMDRIWTERRTAVGHEDSAQAAFPASPDATIQVRLPFSASTLRSQSDAPDFDSESAFPIITPVPTPRIQIRPRADRPIAKAGAMRSQERLGDYVNPPSKGIWLFPPNANGGG
jgi:AAA domain